MMTSARAVNHSLSTDVASPSAPRRKWALTQEAFDRFLASLAEERESAGERYLEIRSKLIRFFEWRGSAFPEDHADEVINRIAKRICENEEIRNPAGYYLGVARMLLLEINRERSKQEQMLSELTRSTITSSPSGEYESRLDCLRDCLQRLSAENRELILRYYDDETGSKIDRRKELADQFGISINTLRMRALRIRENLQRSVEECRRQHSSNRIDNSCAPSSFKRNPLSK